MRQFIALVALASLTPLQVLASTAITSTDSSKYSVMYNDELISQHLTEYKAIESALKVLEQRCCEARIVRQLELRVVKTVVPAQPPDNGGVSAAFTGLELTWDYPNSREGGSELLFSDITGFEIDVNGVLYGTGVVNTTTIELPSGTYTLKIRTLTAEGAGAYSPAIVSTIP